MTTATRPAREGTIPFKGYETWYRVVGEGEEPGKLPLVCLHGGPGAAHDYLEPLEAMADSGRRVIFYDQLGCGNSAIPESKPEMWTTELYVEEIDAVRQALGLDRIHLFGSSWGGMLAMAYALTQPPGLASLIIASSPASISQWLGELARLRNELPPEVQQTLLRHEEAGTTDSDEYQETMLVFYNRHVCRLDPMPDYVQRSFAAIARNPEVYYTMNGPSEFHVIGTMKDYDVVDRLGEIRVPTLITSGRYDEVTPATIDIVHNGIPGSRWVLFAESSHMAFAEEPERYMSVLEEFLAEVEGMPTV